MHLFSQGVALMGSDQRKIRHCAW